MNKTDYNYCLYEKIETEIKGAKEGKNNVIIQFRTIQLAEGKPLVTLSIYPWCDPIFLGETDGPCIVGETITEIKDLKTLKLFTKINIIRRECKKIIVVADAIAEEERQCSKILQAKAGEFNNKEVTTIRQDLDELLILSEELRKNSLNKGRILYLQNVLRIFEEWYNNHSIVPPVNLRRVVPRQKWKSGKSDWARFVKEQYALDEKRTLPDRQFKDLKDATYKLYDDYEFGVSWTNERAYKLVQKC